MYSLAMSTVIKPWPRHFGAQGNQWERKIPMLLRHTASISEGKFDIEFSDKNSVSYEHCIQSWER